MSSCTENIGEVLTSNIRLKTLEHVNNKLFLYQVLVQLFLL